MKNPNFIPALVNKCGYPVWNKTLTNYTKTTTRRTTNEGVQDTIIHLPFVQENTTVVNSFIEALINDTIAIDLFEKYKYTQLPKGNIDATAATADKYINQFFMLQNKVFEHHFFKILDSSLFKTFIPSNVAANSKVKYINIEQEVSNGSQTNSFGLDGCYHYTTSYNTYTDNGIVAHIVHHTICFPPVQSFLLSDLGSGGGGSLGTAGGLGSIGSFTGGSNTSGGTNYSNNPVYTPPTYGSNNNGTNNEVAFIDDGETYQLLEQLQTYLPNLTDDENVFLLDHIQLMREINNYLNANNNQDAKDKVATHIFKMMNDSDYLALVLSHALGSANVTVWWDDYIWFSNPANEPIINPTNKPFWLIEFPINVPEKPIIDNGITVSEVDLNLPQINWPNIGSVANRNNIEALTFGTNGDVTGIDVSVINQPDNILKANMNSLFSACTFSDLQMNQVGQQFMDLFYTNSNNTITATNSTLTNKVKNSPEFINFVKKFGHQFSQTLKAKNGILSQMAISNPSQYQFPISVLPSDRVIFNGLSNRFNGLQILINDTEFTNIDLDSYSADALGNYSANITVTIYDHFGVDKNDALTYQTYHSGFPSWWVLQHKRSKAPFTTKFEIKTKISGNYNLVNL